MHLAEPVELSVEGKVLENAEDADQKPEKHPEPNKAAPILKGAESLHGKKEENQVGDEKQEFRARGVGRSSGMKKPLAANQQGKRRHRRGQMRIKNFVLTTQIKPQSPGEQVRARPRPSNL